ncbi:facilitated trehalose transporter Tret1-2 homolog [Nilaparvata lugens]|uniref:Sugar transporter n=1 Tax=Nilaparvata lugens TaxID=108931 RepID=A0A0A8JAF3_NILLU|nr:facilitated trehalose transporter Tret1-2 homolog [Nilaparvata lugens]BAQ02361.1 sugar transporter [Nilaparvata lugens]
MADELQSTISSNLKQVLVSLISSLGMLQTGMVLGYPAVMLPAIIDRGGNNSTFSVNSNQASWIASLSSISTPIGCLICGPMIDGWGRATTIKIINVPFILGWILIALYQELILIYIGRIICGIAIGLSSIPSAVYITEITSKSMRGALTIIGSLEISAGIIIIYLLGMFFNDDYQYLAWLSAGVSISSTLLTLCFLPESPIWLLNRKKKLQAKKTLMEDQHASDPSIARSEIETLAPSTSQENTSHTKWSRTIVQLRRPQSYKPLIIMNLFFLFQQFSGIMAVIVYAPNFAKDAGITGHIQLVALSIAVVRMFSILIAAWASRKFGRRKPAIFSGIGMTIFLSMLTLNIYIQGIAHSSDTGEIAWLPVTCLLLYIFTSCVGFATLPWSMIGEVFPTEIRGVASGFTACMAYVYSFLSIKFYPDMEEQLGEGGIFLFYFIAATLGTVFVILFLPETQGKTLDEIGNDFAKTNG